MHEPAGFPQFQDQFFTEAVARCIQECALYFQERLVSIYVWGSVHRWEAVRGASDLDLIVFVSHVEESDWSWRNDQINDRLEKEFPGLSWGLIPHPVAISEAPQNFNPNDSELEQLRNRE